MKVWLQCPPCSKRKTGPLPFVWHPVPADGGSFTCGFCCKTFVATLQEDGNYLLEWENGAGQRRSTMLRLRSSVWKEGWPRYDCDLR